VQNNVPEIIKLQQEHLLYLVLKLEKANQEEDDHLDHDFIELIIKIMVQIKHLVLEFMEQVFLYLMEQMFLMDVFELTIVLFANSTELLQIKVQAPKL
jgi:hypothetical protein